MGFEVMQILYGWKRELGTFAVFKKPGVIISIPGTTELKNLPGHWMNMHSVCLCHFGNAIKIAGIKSFGRPRNKIVLPGLYSLFPELTGDKRCPRRRLLSTRQMLIFKKQCFLFTGKWAIMFPASVSDGLPSGCFKERLRGDSGLFCRELFSSWSEALVVRFILCYSRRLFRAEWALPCPAGLWRALFPNWDRWALFPERDSPSSWPAACNWAIPKATCATP
jgi:hypothetical protein